MKQKKILVTGGAGFIGSNLVRFLLDQNMEVMVIDDLSTGNIDNLKEFLKKIEFIKGDIRDLDLLQKNFKRVDTIFHQAAIPSVPRSIHDPINSITSNINGTLNVLVAARDQGVRRLVYASSSSIYGNAKEEFKHEDLPHSPMSPYALAKYTGEKFCQLFYELYGLNTISLRYFNVFGPRQNPDSEYSAVIPKFIKIISKGEKPIIYGDGQASRDFTYVDNVIHANWLASQHNNKLAHGERMNIACGESTTLNQLIDFINKELGTNVKPHYDQPRPGEVKHSKAKIDKAKKLIGYKPVKKFREGLKETVRWYKKILP